MGKILVYSITMVMNIGASLWVLYLVLSGEANMSNIDLSRGKDVMALFILFTPWVTLLYLLVFEEKKDDDQSLLALWIAVKKKKLKDQLS